MWEYQNKPSSKKVTRGIKQSARNKGNEEMKEFFHNELDDFRDSILDQPRASIHYFNLMIFNSDINI